MPRSEEEVLEAIEARRRRPRRKVLDDRITLSHGAGGKASHDLVKGIFVREFSNELLDPLGDSALVGTGKDQLAFTTDSFVVRPLFFPGGDIGELAVNGTINDLAMTGATPLALSASFIVEEGLPVAELERIAASMARPLAPPTCGSRRATPRSSSTVRPTASTSTARAWAWSNTSTSSARARSVPATR
jgi:hydrogenase expression/formation protein HypE